MVGDPVQHQPETAGPCVGQQSGGRDRCVATSKAQDPAVQGKAGDGAQHLLRSVEDGDLVRQGREHRRQLFQPFGIDQHRHRPESGGVHQMAQHHLALGDEQPLPPYEVPFADIAIGLYPGVLEAVDGFQARHDDQASSGRRAVCTPAGRCDEDRPGFRERLNLRSNVTASRFSAETAHRGFHAAKRGKSSSLTPRPAAPLTRAFAGRALAPTGPPPSRPEETVP